MKLLMLLLVVLIFYEVFGGFFGLEDFVRVGGFFFVFFGFIIVLFVWFIFEVLVIVELVIVFLKNGGFVVWILVVFGLFWGF